MNTKQQKFVTEYLKWGIPALAYANAYNKPDPNGRAIESAANRLLRNPEVKQAIHDAEDRIRYEVEKEIANREALDVFTIEQKRHLLKQIATGELLVEQRYKTGDCRHCTQFVRPTINQMLRAIDLDNRMSAHYPPQQQKTSIRQQNTTNETITSPPRKGVCEPGAKEGWVNSRRTENTTTENTSPLQGDLGVHSRGADNVSTKQHFATNDNNPENTNHETSLPGIYPAEGGRGKGGQPAPNIPPSNLAERSHEPERVTQEGHSHEGIPPLKEVPCEHRAEDVLSRETENTTNDNKTETMSPAGGGVTAVTGAASALGVVEHSHQTEHTTNDNKISLPFRGIGGIPTITHAELMELLYPKEEKLQQITTSYDHLPENTQRE